VGGDIGRETIFCVGETLGPFPALLLLEAAREEEEEEEGEWFAEGETEEGEVRDDVALSNFSAISSPASVSLNLAGQLLLSTSPFLMRVVTELQAV
jgi:hypothetical protein